MDKEPITLNGLNKLKEELVFLKEKKRPEIVAAIAEARSHGDLKENAEYHAAKEEQSHNEGRITEINDIIARANVIDVTKLNNDGKDNTNILKINGENILVGKGCESYDMISSRQYSFFGIFKKRIKNK